MIFLQFTSKKEHAWTFGQIAPSGNLAQFYVNIRYTWNWCNFMLTTWLRTKVALHPLKIRIPSFHLHLHPCMHFLCSAASAAPSLLLFSATALHPFAAACNAVLASSQWRAQCPYMQSPCRCATSCLWCCSWSAAPYSI